MLPQPGGSAPDPGDRPNGRLLLVILCVPMFLVLLDVMAMNVAMPTIGGGFGVPVGRWAQVVDAYTIPLAAALLPAGWLVDRFGPRCTLLASIAVFMIASAAGGLAGSWDGVLAARLGQGLAAAVMLPAGLAALSRTWTVPRERAHALGAWSSISAIATALGPALGGLLVAALSWRAVFWVNVPLSVFAIWGTWRHLHPRTTPAPDTRQEHPLRLRALLGSVAVAAMMTSGANGTLQVVTVHLQAERHLAAGPAGLFLLLASAPFVILGPVTGRLIARYGHRPAATAGFALGAVGLATLGRLPGLVGIAPALLGIGLGLGLMTSAIVGESLAAWNHRPGTASGLNNALRQTGTSIGVATGAWATAHWHHTALLERAGTTASNWWLAAALLVGLTFARPTKRRAT